jgi:hypothetical protein
MKKKYYWIVGIIIICIIFIGISSILLIISKRSCSEYSNPIQNEWKTCKEDGDCYSVDTKCCNWCGNPNLSLNERGKNVIENWREWNCETLGAIAVSCASPPIFTKSVCSNNICSLEYILNKNVACFSLLEDCSVSTDSIIIWHFNITLFDVCKKYFSINTDYDCKKLCDCQLPTTNEITVERITYPDIFKGIWLKINIANNKFTLLNYEIVDGYPDYHPGGYPFVARIFSSDGNLLGEYGFNDPRIIRAEQGYTGPTWLDNVNFTPIFPYFNNSKIIKIYSATKLMLSVDISE